MRSALYDVLEQNASMSWICDFCGYQNLSTSIIPDTSLTSNNHDTSIVSIPSTRSLSDSSFHSDIIGSPPAFSSPNQKAKPKKPKGTNNHLKIAVANCQNARTKSKLMEAMLDSIQPDILIGTESHLTPENTNNEIFPIPYSEFAMRRDRDPPDGHGGVFVAIRDHLQPRHATEYNTPDCEITWAELQSCDNHLIFIGAYYRPPRSNETSLQKLHESISNIQQDHSNATIILGGDFNLPGIDWVNSAVKTGAADRSQCLMLLDTAVNCNLEQMNLEPTRQQNILDLCFTSRPGIVQKTTTAPGFSDHDHMVVMETSLKATINKKKPREVYQYKKTNWDTIRQKIEEKALYYWTSLPSENTVSTNWKAFKDMIRTTIDENIPKKTISKRYHLPWLSRGTKRLLNKKKRVYRKAKRTQQETHWEEFHNIRKQCQHETTSDYHKYINSLIDPSEDKTKKNLWSYLKHKRQDSFGVSTLKSNGSCQTTPATKAEALNQQFVSVFTREDLDAMPDKGPSPHPDMAPIVITVNGIRKQMANLKVNKATGPDDIPARFMKECADQLSPILAQIFQQSITTGQVPDDWRRANVVPIFKKGDRTKPSNYRPVSLTAIACKILEHVIVSNMMDHLDKHNILTDYQHGFRQKRSCESQLFITVHDLASALNTSSQIDLAVLDFSKAFDKVPHQRLTRKLEYYGIRGNVNNWIGSFLNNRQQQVVVDGETSSQAPVTSGVPQGSVLGPALFLVYINDITDNINSKIRLFADDCLIYREVKSVEDHQGLQEDLDNLHSWSNTWQMAFNVSKCFTMSVTNARKNKRSWTYSMGGENMEKVDDTSYLGVQISKNLKWNQHIHSITSKANRILGLLRRNLRDTPKEVKECAYHTLVRPKLEYSCAIWNPHTEELKNKLEKVQRTAARFVLNRPYHRGATESVSEMLRELKWVPLERRRTAQALTFIYKMTNGLISIPSSYHPTPLRTSTRNSNIKSYKLYQPRVDAFKYSLLPRTIPIWNKLSNDAVQASTLDTFKARVLTEI